MKQSNNSNHTAHSKVFMMLIEGDSVTVQKAVEAAERTISRSGGYAVRANIGTPTPPRVALPAPSEAISEVVGTSQHEEEVELGQDAPEPPPSQRTPRKARTFTTPEVLDELQADKPPDAFKDFVSGRSITGFIERALTAATWLREKRGVKQFGVGHLHTCFRMMAGWKLPDDPSSILRNMKKSQYVKKVGEGLYELTTVGDSTYSDIK